MKYRKLRIAWSVVWGVLCVALVALWVRSFWRWDHISGTAFGKYCTILAVRGTIGGYYRSDATPTPWSWSSFSNLRKSGTSQRVEADGRYGMVAIELDLGPMGFRAINNSVFMPHWFPTALALTLGTMPWLTWRFSLRTLLIGMTVAAIGLGWIVYALRN